MIPDLKCQKFGLAHSVHTEAVFCLPLRDVDRRLYLMVREYSKLTMFSVLPTTNLLMNISPIDPTENRLAHDHDKRLIKAATFQRLVGNKESN